MRMLGLLVFRLFYGGKLVWYTENVIRYDDGKLTYTTFMIGEIKCSQFMKWLKYDKNHLSTPLWYVSPEKKYNGDLREIEIEDDLEVMTSQLGSMIDFELYVSGPHSTKEIHHSNKEADGPGKNIGEKSDDDDTTYNVTNSYYESEELELSRDDMENEEESDLISETPVTMFKPAGSIVVVKGSENGQEGTGGSFSSAPKTNAGKPKAANVKRKHVLGK
ncbi:hypothetical protein ACFE04_020119 [Oxalis oulophora]